MGQKNYTAADMSKVIRQTNVLERKPDDAEALKEVAEKDTIRNEQQQAALTEAKVTVTTLQRAITPRRERHQRISDRLQQSLSKFADADSGSAAAVNSWVNILEAVEKRPRKDVFDEILKFFVVHRGDTFLDQMHALQGIEKLDTAVNLKVRVLYETMRNLASGEATLKNLAVERLRTIIRPDDFANWVGVKIAELARANIRRS